MADDKNEVKERIIKSAVKLFEHYGFNKTTVDDIAEEAGIGKGTVYLHFKSKNEILIGCILSFNECISAELKKTFEDVKPIKERVKALILAKYLTVFEYISSTPHGAEIVQQTRNIKGDIMCAVKEFREEMVGYIAQSIEEGIQEGSLEVKEPYKIAEYICFSFDILLPANFHVYFTKESAREYIDTLIDLYFDGMKKC